MNSVFQIKWPQADAGKYFVPVERCPETFWQEPQNVTPGTMIKIRNRRYRVIEYRLAPHGFIADKVTR